MVCRCPPNHGARCRNEALTGSIMHADYCKATPSAVSGSVQWSGGSGDRFDGGEHDAQTPRVAVVPEDLVHHVRHGHPVVEVDIHQRTAPAAPRACAATDAITQAIAHGYAQQTITP